MQKHFYVCEKSYFNFNAKTVSNVLNKYILVDIAKYIFVVFLTSNTFLYPNNIFMTTSMCLTDIQDSNTERDTYQTPPLSLYPQQLQDPN